MAGAAPVKKKKQPLPLISPAASRRKVTQLAAVIEVAIQRNAAVPRIRSQQLDTKIKSVALRYAMMDMGDVNRGFPVWLLPKLSEQTIKREIVLFRDHCARFLTKASEANFRQLIASAANMSLEAARAVPEFLFYLSALCDGTISSDKLEALISSATKAIELVPDAKPHAGTGRPKKAGASAVALMLAVDFRTLTGKEPKFGGNQKNGESPFAALVSDIFKALKVKASAPTESRKAVRARKKNVMSYNS